MSAYKIGLQLYSVRGELERDFEGTLTKVKAMGYDYVEFAGFYGHTPQQVKEILDRLGLKAVSAHISTGAFAAEPELQTGYLTALGIKYAVVPWMPHEKFASAKGIEEVIADVVAMSKALQPHGIKVLYHNHDFELYGRQGATALDEVLIKAQDYIDAEPDTCWISYAGKDAKEFLTRYSGRVPVVHIKDYAADSAARGTAAHFASGRIDYGADNFVFRPLGQGVLDIKGIIDAAVSSGAQYLIVEQDNTYDLPSLEAVKMSIDYLNKIL